MTRKMTKQNLSWLNDSQYADVPEKTKAQYRRIWESAAEIDVPEPTDVGTGLRDLNRRIAASDHVSRHGMFWSRLGLPLPAMVAVAGVLAMAVVLTFLMRPQIIQTGRGQQQMATLPDDTQVVLNAESTLRLAWGFGERHRRLELDGEAFFSVTESTHPFVVITPISEITVLGTEFNVRHRDDLLEVGVTRGRVSVAAGENGLRQTVELTAGQMTRCARDGFPTTPESVPTPQYPPWKFDSFYFDDTPLDLACKEIARALNVPITIDDPALNSVKVTGLLHGKDAESLIGSLCLLIDREYGVQSGRYIIR